MTLHDNATHYTVAPVSENLMIGVVGKRHNAIDYSEPIPETRSREKKIIQNISGIPKKHILFMEQFHGDSVVIAHHYPHEDSTVYARADALVTQLGSLCAVVRTADCVPLFIHDPVRNVLGAVHSGWRGTKLNIAAKTARLMEETFSSKYREMKVYILPSIGPQSYEVQQDVARFFPGSISHLKEKIFLDLWKSITESLVNAGIPAENISKTSLCTYQKNNDFFSHRRGDSGRNLNFAYIK